MAPTDLTLTVGGPWAGRDVRGARRGGGHEQLKQRVDESPTCPDRFAGHAGMIACTASSAAATTAA